MFWVCLRLQHYLKETDLAIVIHALVTLRLACWIVVYMELPLKKHGKLKLPQNLAIGVLSGSTVLLRWWFLICTDFQSLPSLWPIMGHAWLGLWPKCVKDSLLLHTSAWTLSSPWVTLHGLMPSAGVWLAGMKERVYSSTAHKLGNPPWDLVGPISPDF